MPISTITEQILENPTYICFQRHRRVRFGRSNKHTRCSWLHVCAEVDTLTGRKRNGRAHSSHTQRSNSHSHSYCKGICAILATWFLRRRLQIQSKAALSKSENTTTWTALTTLPKWCSCLDRFGHPTTIPSRKRKYRAVLSGYDMSIL